MQQPILEIQNMTKVFGSTVALDHVDLKVFPGEIRGLIGENGSGKSTISSIAAGMQPATGGSMTFKNKAWKPTSMTEALEQGIGMIVQEQGTIPGISIAENIFLGELDEFKQFGFIHKKKMNERAKQILNLVDMQVDPSRAMASLDLQDRKLVEIAKVIVKDPEIFIVDETTTTLSQTGRKKIYELMKEQKEKNKSVLFISHDLDELMEVCDTLTVLRDGKLIDNLNREQFDGELIKQLMVGRELKGDYYRSDFDGSCGEKVVMRVDDLVVGEELKHVSMELHEGEILGIGGLSSCGMHTLGKAMFGAARLEGGQVTCHDEVLHNPGDAMRHKVGYVSKDRDVEALNLGASIRENIAIAGLDKIQNPGPFLLKKNETEFVQAQVENLSVKCHDIDQNVNQLSGGNKQKVVFGKWIGAGSDILVLDCPTRGVDIGVKQAMYQLIYHMKKSGKSIVLISEEMAELIGMSDRVLIMKNGEVTGELKRSQDLEESAIINYMI